ncbi:MAG: hypothetical protein FRX49_06927 [Trebouxia sp. A1-2]|nr:MAG: hypothetical protein FRX49_06927 [Trebouxia sp. A1-2]
MNKRRKEGGSKRTSEPAIKLLIKPRRSASAFCRASLVQLTWREMASATLGGKLCRASLSRNSSLARCWLESEAGLGGLSQAAPVPGPESCPANPFMVPKRGWQWQQQQGVVLQRQLVRVLGLCQGVRRQHVPMHHRQIEHWGQRHPCASCLAPAASHYLELGRSPATAALLCTMGWVCGELSLKLQVVVRAEAACYEVSQDMLTALTGTSTRGPGSSAGKPDEPCFSTLSSDTPRLWMLHLGCWKRQCRLLYY